MEKYIGVKMIMAEPAVRIGGHINYTKDEAMPKSMALHEEGYRVTYADGYTSWSPKDVFEEAYRHIDGMTFGFAIEAAKKGSKIARKGWNGKGMFVVYQKGYPDGIPSNKQTAIAWGLKEGEDFVCNPYLQIKQVDGSHSMWVPSIGDVLAEDWYIVE